MFRRSLAISLSRQRWLPYKTRRSVIKRIHPAMLKDFAFEVDFFGMRFRGNIVNYIDRLIYFCGAHEKYMLMLLKRYVENARRHGEHDITFFDVGANAGNHTLFMARQADRVHAFEPFDRVRHQLQENLALNRITNVTVHPFGLSNENKIMPFYSGPDSNLGAASFLQDHKQDNYYLGDMQLRCGDDVVLEANIARVDILKADVEGFEKFVLEGLQATLHRDRPLMIIELSPTTRETLGAEAGFHALFPPDYRFYYFARGSNDSGQYRLESYNYRMTPRIQDVIACPMEKLRWLSVL